MDQIIIQTLEKFSNKPRAKKGLVFGPKNSEDIAPKILICSHSPTDMLSILSLKSKLYVISPSEYYQRQIKRDYPNLKFITMANYSKDMLFNGDPIMLYMIEKFSGEFIQLVRDQRMIVFGYNPSPLKLDGFSEYVFGQMQLPVIQREYKKVTNHAFQRGDDVYELIKDLEVNHRILILAPNTLLVNIIYVTLKSRGIPVVKSTDLFDQGHYQVCVCELSKSLSKLDVNMIICISTNPVWLQFYHSNTPVKMIYYI